jgi:hypothetical protein
MRAATPMPIGGVATMRKGRPVKAATPIPSTAGFLLHCESFEANLAFAQPTSETHNMLMSNTLTLLSPHIQCNCESHVAEG